jgi:predicted nuclease with TOPRIM domain
LKIGHDLDLISINLMSKEIRIKSNEQELSATELVDATEATKQVAEIKDAVDKTVAKTRLPDKMEDLRTILENLSDEVDSWRAWHKNDYLAAIETLKSQVEEIQSEWESVSGSIMTQRERLESLLQSVPGVIETATLKALSLRIAHLEQLVSQIFQESQTQATLRGSRKQYLISIVALGITIILWGVFIGLNILK